MNALITINRVYFAGLILVYGLDFSIPFWFKQWSFIRFDSLSPLFLLAIALALLGAGLAAARIASGPVIFIIGAILQFYHLALIFVAALYLIMILIMGGPPLLGHCCLMLLASAATIIYLIWGLAFCTVALFHRTPASNQAAPHSASAEFSASHIRQRHQLNESRKRDLVRFYETWPTEDLVAATTIKAKEYDPEAIQIMIRELSRRKEIDGELS